MNVVSTRQFRPTTPADLHRLLGVAYERGLRLFQEHTSGAWFCTSASTPNEMHYLTGYSCTCRGFCSHQRCSHHALLLDRLGWLPEIEDELATDAPTTALTTLCHECSGGGVIYVPKCSRAGWPHPTCPECQGTGELPVTQPQSAPETVPAHAA